MPIQDADLMPTARTARCAVVDNVNSVRCALWQEGGCTSFTELLAARIHRDRLLSWPEHYPWIKSTGLQYFRNRL